MKHNIWRLCMYKTSVHFWTIMLLSSLDAVCSCGQTILGKKGKIKTPNYPENYDNNLNCSWTIKVAEHDTITVRFVGFDVEKNSSGVCLDHFRIYDGPNTSGFVLLDTCGWNRLNPIISSGSTLTVTFVTNELHTETGVSLVWSVSDKFTISLNPVTWSEANTACMKGGGHLATQNELTEISLTKLLSNFTGNVWLGDRLKDSACKTIKRQKNALLRTENQPNCDLKHGFVCQTEAILCGEIFLTDNGNIIWPGYQEHYENNEYCVWEIHVADGRSINVIFINIDVEYSIHCSLDSIEISDTSTDGANILDKLCGKASNVTISSSSNKVMIKFRSDKYTGGSGFKLKWRSESIPTSSPISGRVTKTSTGTDVSTNDLLEENIPTSSPNSGGVTKTSTDTDVSTNDPLEGGIIAGIVVGGLIVIVVAIVLAVLLRRRMMVTHKQEATELEPGNNYNKEGSLSYRSQKNVYITPIPKELRKLQEQSSGERSSSEPDNDYYHHLHQAPISSSSANLPSSSNTYDKLQTDDMYDHTTDAAASTVGEAYAHLDEKKMNSRNAENRLYNCSDNAINQPVQENVDYEYEYIVQNINNPAVVGPKADNQTELL